MCVYHSKEPHTRRGRTGFQTPRCTNIIIFIETGNDRQVQCSVQGSNQCLGAAIRKACRTSGQAHAGQGSKSVAEKRPGGRLRLERQPPGPVGYVRVRTAIAVCLCAGASDGVHRQRIHGREPFHQRVAQHLEGRHVGRADRLLGFLFLRIVSYNVVFKSFIYTPYG